ncbi:MAG: hypothetical protein H6881_08030 [Rhodobiaceae bacterium]|nr:hypothetical protein [Rhodobiaceae bacterium]
MLIDMTAPMDSDDLRGWRSWRFRGRRQERRGGTGGKGRFAHDEPDLRRKLGTCAQPHGRTPQAVNRRAQTALQLRYTAQQSVNRVCLPHIIQFAI